MPTLHVSRKIIVDLSFMTLGALLGAVQVVVFMVPAEVVPGGVSSLGIILKELFGLPIGGVVLVANIPIQIVGYRWLGGWRVIARTVYVVVVYAIAVDVLSAYGSLDAISDDRLLLALFGGALGGVAGGLIFRAGGTFGGTSTLARILQLRNGTPLSTTYLFTDAALIAGAGLVFGWESSLYAIVALVMGGLAADYVLEGPSVIRTVVIVTDHPQEIAEAIMHGLSRTLTGWQARGMYTDQTHTVLYVTVLRSEANALRQVVLTVDPDAFVVIGQGHSAYGSTFRR